MTNSRKITHCSLYLLLHVDSTPQFSFSTWVWKKIVVLGLRFGKVVLISIFITIVKGNFTAAHCRYDISTFIDCVYWQKEQRRAASGDLPGLEMRLVQSTLRHAWAVCLWAGGDPGPACAQGGTEGAVGCPSSPLHGWHASWSRRLWECGRG